MSLKQIWQAANPKGHLLTAISFLIPIVCGAGFIIAIGMGLGGTVQDTLTPGQFDLWQAMATLGAKALGLLPVVIAVGISGSIAGKPGIAPGLDKLLSAYSALLSEKGGCLAEFSARLDTLSPLKTLARGYAVAIKSGETVRKAEELNVGDSITLKFTDGNVKCKVTEKEQTV